MVARLFLLADDAFVGVKASGASPGQSPPLFPHVDREASLAVGALVGIIVGAVGAAVLIFLFVWYIQRRLKSDSAEDESFLETLEGLPPRFSYKELQTATNNFESKLGAGAFATVFHGTLVNGEQIAVKRLIRQVGSQDFRAEVATVGSIHHVNLVRLRGFCAQGSHRLLVYEFLSNGSLDKWLFSDDHNHQESLDWSKRFNIAVGTAKGLAYLHDDCAKRIIHFDIKPQNILLDDHFLPKVSDFGLSKISDKETSSELITTLRGTPGYVAPEWIMGVAITEKGDVYSYGLVLFELMSGRKNLETSDNTGKSYFPGIALQEVREHGYERGSLSKLVDPGLMDVYDEDQARRLLKVAFWCIQENPDDRPNMREAVLMLEGRLHLLDPPFMRFPGLYQKLETMRRELLEKQAFGDETVILDSEKSSHDP